MSNVLVVGGTRGLGYELAKYYAQSGHTVTGTARGSPPKDAEKAIKWVSGVDISKEDGGKTLAGGLNGAKQDIVLVVAGSFKVESLSDADFEAEVDMFRICAIGPIFIVKALYKAGLLKDGCKIILVSSEAGSITLRHEKNGGGMFGHHASKAALNMNGKQLSHDLKGENIAVAMVHPGFMRTELTRSNGLDKFWDAGGAVTPDVAAKSLAEWVEKFDISKTGQFWAPRGPGDIGTVEETVGPKDKLSTPFQIPW